MPNMQPREAIERMIHASVKTAERMSGRDAAVGGLLSGLRHLRDVVIRQGGEDAGLTFDDSVRDHVLGYFIGNPNGDPALMKVAIPEGAFFEPRAAAIMRDVSESCLVLNSVAQDEGIFAHTVTGFLDELIARLGGLPDWSELEAALKSAEPSAVWEVSPMHGGVTVH